MRDEYLKTTNGWVKRKKQYRHKGFDYSNAGYYFVTIVTKNRENVFGEIIDGKMHLNKIGEIVKNCWQGIPENFETIFLDEFIIMPNHLHGIVVINFSIPNNPMQMRKTTLGKIIRWFKGKTTFQIRKIFWMAS
jgi:putative transposase